MAEDILRCQNLKLIVNNKANWPQVLCNQRPRVLINGPYKLFESDQRYSDVMILNRQALLPFVRIQNAIYTVSQKNM